MQFVQVTPQSMGPNGMPGSYQPPDRDEFREELPMRVRAALSFVDHCNANMGYRFWPNDECGEARILDLHPSQEGAFRLALILIGNYFAGKDLNAHGSHGDAGNPGTGSEPEPESEQPQPAGDGEFHAYG